MGWVELCTAGMALGALAWTSHEPFEAEQETAMVQAALVGGTTVLRPADMPFAFARIGASQCSGVLVHKRAVLTASHCVSALKQANFVIVGSKNNAWPSKGAQEQVLGAGMPDDIRRYRRYMERFAWVHDVERVWDAGFKVLNPNDPSGDQTGVTDAALIILKQPSHLPVALLPKLPLAQILPGKTLYMFGAGRTDPPATPGVLKVASVKFSGKPQCVDFIKKYKAHIPGAHNYINAINDPSMFCQLTPKGVSACNGDSGGPVTYVSPTGKHVVVGIFSSGSKRCGTELPAGTFNVLVNVYYYSKVLRQILATL